MKIMKNPCMMKCICMSRKPAASFSAIGHTASVAEHFAKALGADLVERASKIQYSKKNPDGPEQGIPPFCQDEDPTCQLEMEPLRDNMADYDTIYPGYPI